MFASMDKSRRVHLKAPYPSNWNHTMNKTYIIVFSLCASISANTFFAIGPDSFRIELPGDEYTESFKAFVSDDISRVFTPLQSISNIVNVADIESSPQTAHPLTFREWYPEGFFGALYVTNQAGNLLFKMNERLVRRYMQSYEWWMANTNKVTALHSILDDINSGTTTNQPPHEAMSLIFVPERSSYTLHPEEAYGFLQMLVRNAPFTVSISSGSSSSFMLYTPL